MVCQGFCNQERLLQFHSYAHQNHNTHDSADNKKAIELQRLETVPSAIDVCHEIIQMWGRKAGWLEAKKYFDYVFELHSSVMVSGPGQGFEQ